MHENRLKGAFLPYLQDYYLSKWCLSTRTVPKMVVCDSQDLITSSAKFRDLKLFCFHMVGPIFWLVTLLLLIFL